MKRKKIQAEYQKKIKLINEFNKYYYDKSDPLVTDSEYDKIKKEILLLENKFKFLKSMSSPSNLVGYKPSKILKSFA